MMTRDELENRLADEDVRMSASALIEHEGVRGIALRLGENLCDRWQSGDVIVFWANGDHTILPDTFELVREGDLFDASGEGVPRNGKTGYAHRYAQGMCSCGATTDFSVVSTVDLSEVEARCAKCSKLITLEWLAPHDGFQQGPIDEPVEIETPEQFADVFGQDESMEGKND